MKKVFVLDTNVILLDPQAIFKFADNDVHIPLICIEELDKFKKDQSENGRNARWFSRIVDQLRSQGCLADGVKVPGGGTLFINDIRTVENENFSQWIANKNDNLILGTALYLKEKKKLNVILITKDINLRLKADTYRMAAEDYHQSQLSPDSLYSGHRELEVKSEDLSDFLKKGFVAIPQAGEINLCPNEYVSMFDPADPGCRLYGRYSKQQGGVVPLISVKEGVWGIYPKNLEQHFALDALLNDEVKLVSLVGKAGTGKTLLAIAAALDKTISQNSYIRLLVARPVQPLGKDLGYLPGDIQEKIGPWMQPIYDALDFLFGKQRSKSDGPAAWGSLKDKGILQVEPLTYIRGRSIPSQYFVIDEAQNLTPHEVKTIVTRAAEGSKLILCGDTEQIDNPYLDSINNGLAYAVERMKNETIVAHVALTTGERSDLSELASKLL